MWVGPGRRHDQSISQMLTPCWGHDDSAWTDSFRVLAGPRSGDNYVNGTVVDNRQDDRDYDAILVTATNGRQRPRRH